MTWLRIRHIGLVLIALSSTGCGSADEQETQVHNPEWSEFQQRANDRTVYVSAEGDDAWDGLAPVYQSGVTGPKRTLDGGMRQIRDGSADRLLLRRGDRFRDSVEIRVAGRSATEPILISSYGQDVARPVVVGGVSIAPPERGEVNHLAITDIRFEGGFIHAHQGHHITVEGCHFRGAEGAVYATGPAPRSHWRIRLNTAYRTASTTFYLTRVDDLLIEGNVIHEPAPLDANAAIFVSREGSANVVTRGNLIYIGKEVGNGIMQGAGGVVEDNVLVDVGWTAIEVGACNDDHDFVRPCLGPVPASIRGNAILGGRGVLGGIVVRRPNVQPGVEVMGNLFVQGSPEGIGLVLGGDGAVVRDNVFHNALVGLTGGDDVTWAHNLLWTDRDVPLLMIDDLRSMHGFTARGNRYDHAVRVHLWFLVPFEADFQAWRTITGETGSDRPFEWVDATRDVGSYFASVGGENDTEAFFLEALRLSKGLDRAELKAAAVLSYLREGYARR